MDQSFIQHLYFLTFSGVTTPPCILLVYQDTESVSSGLIRYNFLLGVCSDRMLLYPNKEGYDLRVTSNSPLGVITSLVVNISIISNPPRF